MANLLLAVIYLAFISLGLPDALLGAAWPTAYPELQVPLSYAGIISMIISAGTILSSLQSDRLTKRFGPGRVTAASVAMTAAALFGFSVSRSFPALCLWAVPYGLGAGSVDAALNNYVALHYKSRQMSWLHCMWGVGATTGPYIMGYALTGGLGWHAGYRIISLMQLALTAVLIFTLPLWNAHRKHTEHSASASSGSAAAGVSAPQDASAAGTSAPRNSSVSDPTAPRNPSDAVQSSARALTLPEIFRIPGAKEILISFFCYSALEQTTGLWAGSYLTLARGISPERAAAFAGLFYLGITGGRAVSGFLTMKFNDRQMIRLGQGIIALALLILFLPLNENVSLAGFVLTGLGCAPIYPCIIHSTPERFGAEQSQALIGVQMAFAYIGSCLMPPLFGLIANHISAALLPADLLCVFLLMVFMSERLNRLQARGA